jgi:hypothetical protein
MISIVINCDTRPGFNSEVSKVGDKSGCALIGCRSIDFITDGVRNKREFFRGHEVEVVLCVDKHLDLPANVSQEVEDMLSSGVINTYEIKSFDRSKFRWNDHVYLDALKKAKGDYVVHYDGDACAFRKDSCTIVDDYISWLDSGKYDFICQPSNMSYAEHNMWWASTRFFICKREMLNFGEIEKCLNNAYLWSKHTFIDHPYPCCLEHTLGVMAGDGRVLYPPRDDDQYLVFSWAHYYADTLKKLSAMTYEEAADVIVNRWGLCGPNDVVGRQLI